MNPRMTPLYHYCRMQMPAVATGREAFEGHLLRTHALFAAKSPEPVQLEAYLETLYVTDWYLCVGCLERDEWAWKRLFSVKTGKGDAFLMDALRARAFRLYPRDGERQENAVGDFYSLLLVSDSDKALPILARYDGQRPLTPWLIRVFQNLHISKLRSHSGTVSLPDDDVTLPLPPRTETRWHESFIAAARAWLAELTDAELLLLGLRWRYKLSQRDIAAKFKVHEGTISRQTDKLRDHCLQKIGKELTAIGWAGEDLEEYILTEMAGVLMDEPRLGLDNLARMLAAKGIGAG